MHYKGIDSGILVATFLTSGVSNFSVGFALAGYNASGLVLEDEKPWNHINTVLITASGILGLMLGALLTEKLLFLGRFRTALLANLVVLLSVLPMMIFTVTTHIIGRIMLGFGGGMFTVVCSVFVAETIPNEKLDAVGTSINFGIVSGLLITSLIQGLSLPDAGQEVSPMSWRIGFMAPGVFAVMSSLMWAFWIKSDSLFFLID